jgi:hypothetical protein
MIYGQPLGSEASTLPLMQSKSLDTFCDGDVQAG